MKFKSVLSALTLAGHEAWFVGGCVRDHLLGRESKDVDICTSATPDEIRAVFPDAEMVGAHFGVSLIKTMEGTVEVATYRLDGAYSDGRHPDEVKFTKDVLEDLQRRDFTVNALLMGIDGEVVDHVGGVSDLRDGILRCVGFPAKRFTEDALRVMRAVRFACQLGFTIEPVTFDALTSSANLLRNVSRERIAQELVKILTSGKAGYGIRLMDLARMFPYVMPELWILKETAQNPKHHPEGNVLTHTICVVKQLKKGCSQTLALGALLHDIGKPESFGIKNGQPTFYGHDEMGAKTAERILTDLRFSNDVISQVVFLVENHMKFMVADQMRRGKLLRWVRQDGFEELLELHRMDALAGSGNLNHYEFVSKVLAETPPDKIRPEQLVNGNDLIDLGHKPGPQFKEWLEYVETLQLEGMIDTREQAMMALYDVARRG